MKKTIQTNHGCGGEEGLEVLAIEYLTGGSLLGSVGGWVVLRFGWGLMGVWVWRWGGGAIFQVIMTAYCLILE